MRVSGGCNIGRVCWQRGDEERVNGSHGSSINCHMVLNGSGGMGSGVGTKDGCVRWRTEGVEWGAGG